jgi:hypothetical protein
MLATQIVYNAGNKWMAKDLGLDMKALEQNSRGKDRQALMREERK